MNWYLIHTKPRQEERALLNLAEQGYECYLPVMSSEKLKQEGIATVDEPLFPRYLFVRLGKGDCAKGWGPVRSTKGVSRLVMFGSEPAKVEDRLVSMLRAQESRWQEPRTLFQQGERVLLTEGPFVGLDAIYDVRCGESRVMVLIEILSKQIQLSVSPSSLRKVG